MTSETNEVLAHAASVGDDVAHQAAFQQLVLERSHDLITVIDPNGVVVYASPSWRTLGWDPDALRGTPILDFVHPADAGRGAEAALAVLPGAEVGAVTVHL